MTAHGVIDAGAILALLDSETPGHARCAQAFREARLPLLTSGAVLAEVFRIVGSDRRRVEAAWGFLRSGAVVLGAIADAELAEVQGLMARYENVPMDFVDATLVYLARRESLGTVVTLDGGDFESYFVSGKRKFTVLPGRNPT
jgi:predicted nucleic acid-binding protein